MIVAAGAADRQAEHRGADRAEHVVELVVAVLLDLVLGDLRAVDAGGQEAGRRQGQRVVRLELVAGDLPLDERVVRQVLVERLDDEVAIVIGGRPVVVVLEAVALGEAGQVEPVPGPALAVVRDGEQPVDQLREGVRRGVVDERLRPPRASAAGRSGRSRRGESAAVGSAGGLGVELPASSFARMKRSIGVLHQAASFTAGGSARCSG